MRTRRYTVFALLVSAEAFSQTPNWEWARSAGGEMLDGATSMAADPTYNGICVAGSFESDSIEFGTYTLVNANDDSTDVFIMKYDLDGNVLWARSAGGSNNDRATSVATDAFGNVIVVGSFSSDSITFESQTLMNTSIGFSDMFVVKYDPDGYVLWARSAGGDYDDEATAVATDTMNRIVVTGYYQADNIDFGSGPLTNAGSYDMFIVRYRFDGQDGWRVGVGGTNDDRGYAITIDDSGNALVAGAFLSSSIDFGTDMVTYSGGAYSDIFLAKYDPVGASVWAVSAGGTYLDEANALATDTSGNIYMTGIAYSTSIVFGADTLFNSGSAFYCDIFLVKYDPAGNPEWARGVGAGGNNDIAYDVHFDAGSIHIVGVYGDPITFGSFPLSGGGVFLVEYDTDGTVLWATGVEGGSATTVTTDQLGDLYVAGNLFDADMTFGTTTLNNEGVYDMYMAKLSTPTGVADVQASHAYTVYPNPIHERATLQFENPTNASYTFKLYDAQGRFVMAIPDIAGDNLVIDRGDISDGLYFFELRSTDRAIVKGKLVVE